MKITFFSGADEVEVAQLPVILRGEKGDSIVGPRGPDGKSAYEVALDAGFVGTEAEWLESQRGQQGSQGPAGTSVTVTSFTSRVAYDAYVPGPLELAVYVGTA